MTYKLHTLTIKSNVRPCYASSSEINHAISCYASSSEINHAILPMHKLHHIGPSHCKLDKGFHWNNPTAIICIIGSKDFPMIFFCIQINLFIFMCFVHGKAKWSHFNEVKCIIHTCNCTYTLKCLHILHLFKLPKFPSTTQYCSNSHHLPTHKSKKNSIHFIFYSFSHVSSCWHGSKGFVKPNMETHLIAFFFNDFLSTFHFYNRT
jgi:hypothetical protein